VSKRARQRVTERRLVDVLVAYLRKDTAVAREVGHYEKRIDVVSVDRKSGEVWAIEAKTSAWPRAIGQAIVNLAASERSFVAIYSAHAHRVPRDILAEHGLGLIAVGTRWGEVEVLVEAPPSPYQNRLLVNRLRESMLRE
jgi:hypothetical protein